MKAMALLLVLITVALGTYLARLPKTETTKNDAMIEDAVGSQMAAPEKTSTHTPDIPL